MGSLTRKMKRKQQREWSYKKYESTRLARQKNARIESAKKEFIQTYKKIIPNIIPDWQVKLALLFPPLWYNNTICFLLRIISPKENREILLQLSNRGKKSFFRMFRFWIANTIYTATILSMLAFRTIVCEFGIKTKIDTTHNNGKEYLRFRILRFSKCFHEEEVEL